ncbi:MAG: hypothetical protein L3J69_05265, partial [Desulfobacula sp.]|nr:hypothetical protein [Desulfobacula sp.]
FISGKEKEVSTDSDLWKLLLLGDKAWVSKQRFSKDMECRFDITIGDYFTAARHFLSENDFHILRMGLNALLNYQTQPNDIRRLDLFLEKHGSFYHPLRLEAVLQDGNTCSFVINGAISQQGLTIIQNEYHIIKALSKKQIPSYLPAVFGCSMFQMNNKNFGFFLGQWLEGFKEFHITRVNDEKKVVIWDSDGRCNYIRQEKAFPIYKDIAKILTLYYDLETFRQIYPWHHAAGDFIIRQNKEGFDTMLITIRGYENLSDFDLVDSDSNASAFTNPESIEPDQSVLILPSLLMFFLNLSLRVRLDRMDGTGEPVAVDEKILSFVVDGFLVGLDQKGNQYNEPDLRKGFIDFCNQFSMDQIMEMMVNIVESHPPGTLEIELVQEILISHCRLVHAIFKRL